MQLPKNLKSNSILIAIAGAYFFLYGLASYVILGKLQLCVWRGLTGFPCPGCGLTHAGLFLLSFNIKESLIWNPFLIPIIFTIFITCIPQGWNKWCDKFKQCKTLFWSLFIAMLLYYIIRLILFFPQAETEGPMYYSKENYILKTYFSITELIKK